MRVEKLFRSYEIKRGGVDEKSRTLSLTFSSEEPVERWFGFEVLDHSPQSVRLDRLKRSAPLLWNHDPQEQIGVVDSVSISQGRGSARVRFGKTARAQEIFTDVLDEVIRNTSVGYRIFEMALEKKEGDLEHYRIVDWEPLEISLVSIPADVTVGVGREEKKYEVRIFAEEDNRMREKNDDKDLEKEDKSERFRVKEILATGERCKMEAEAIEAIKNGTSVDDFRKVAFERISTKTGPITTDVRDLQAEKPFRSLGEQLVAIAIAGKAAGSGRREVDKRLDYIMERAATGMGAQIPSDGGFLLQTDFSLALMNKAEQESQLIKYCFRIPIGQGSDGVELPVIDEVSRATGSRWGGVRVYRIGEADTVTASKPKLGKIELRLEGLFGICYVTDRLLKNAPAAEAIVNKGFASEMGFRIDDEIINGAGAGQMLGILKSPALVSVAKEAGQAAATIVYENLIKMWARLPGRCRKGCLWLYNQEIEPQFFSLGLSLGTGGAPVWLPAGGGISTSPFSTLFGRPMIPIEQAAALGTVGDIILTDLGEYIVIEQGGIDAQMSIHVRFIYNENTFKFTAYNNGTPAWKQPLTPYKGTATLSPFVVLSTRV